ncbi:hypothetical protein MLD38_033316 [Melastoma candidum]|uniref:Uncharacterized protein n=1 Tax=Melastoma candidum TaxID=119954 RepID=A0ACB9M633_9MYRT|nr:hypothetical protein MLD38_033316 [Melastoma candidum]
MLGLGFKADESSLLAALKASTGLQTRQLHSTSIKMGYEDKECVLSSLITLYTRNGLTSDALAFVSASDEILSVVPANAIAEREYIIEVVNFMLQLICFLNSKNLTLSHGKL